MRIFIILSLILLSFSFTGCKKLTTFNLDYHSTATIPSTLGTLVPFSVSTPEVETNSSYQFEVNKTDSDHIKTIYLSDLVLTITSPSSETFSFLNEVDLYISSPNHDEMLIASKTDIPDNVGSTLTLTPTSTDLKDYVKDSNFTIRVKVITDETIPQDVTLDIYSNFSVQAKIFKSK